MTTKKQLYINLPVYDVDASMRFYRELGFVVYSLFTFDNQVCMKWSDEVYVMLQSHEMFRSGGSEPFLSTGDKTTATFTLPVDSIAQLNEMMERGLLAGGSEKVLPRDEGFMQVRNIQDLDGHCWSILCLDLEEFKAVTGKS